MGLDLVSASGRVRGASPGREALQRWFREWSDGLDQIHYEAEEIVEANDHVLSKSNMRARGRASGIEVDSTLYAVWTIREGKIVEVVWSSNQAEALEAAGLSE